MIRCNSEAALVAAVAVHLLACAGCTRRSDEEVAKAPPVAQKHVAKPTPEVRVKKINELRWKPMWVTHLGCIKGCLDYLDVDVSDAWLFGGTGHAFIMNIHDELCPSGPTCWKSDRMAELGRNIGYEVSSVTAQRTGNDFVEKQKQAWEMTREAINEGIPCYGWELETPEYYVVYGYDDVGYYYSGALCDNGKGPRPWHTLGETEIAVLQMCAVAPCEPADLKTTIKDALEYALAFAQATNQWAFRGYSTGLAAYDAWMRALETNKASGVGTAFNAAVWAECRNHAVQFLKDAKKRMGGTLCPLLDEAAGRYEVVAENLRRVADTFPFLDVTDEQKEENIKDESRRNRAVECLRRAKEAEAAGLKTLEKLVRELT